jgi:hypothetical protein
MKRTALVILAVVAVLFCEAGQARADVITYTESDTATGSIGATAFTGATVTITLVGSTTGVVSSSEVSGALVNIGPGTISISGIAGSIDFTDPLDVFQYGLTGGAVGIGQSSAGDLGADILDTLGSAFETYDLATAFGPSTGSAATNLDYAFATADGALTFSSIGDDSTFTATTGAVATPEPSSLLLLGAGLLGLGMMGMRKRISRSLPQAA